MINIIISIILITTITWLINKFNLFRICPICSGIFLTWTFALLGMNIGLLSTSFYQLPTAILAGGSIVGIMLKIEKNIKSENLLLWKTIFSIIGFLVVYSLIIYSWSMGVIGILFLIIITIIFKKKKIISDPNKLNKLEEIKEKLKNCCD